MLIAWAAPARPARPARPAHQRRPDRPLPPRRRPLPRRRRRLGALRRPAFAAVAIACPLLLLAAPALAFDTGSPGVDELSPSSPARQDSEAISDAVGAGWQAPFILTVAADDGPITAAPAPRLPRPRRSAASTALPGVEAVIGPAAIAAAARPLRSLGAELDPGGSSSAAQLTRLGPRLHQASGAVSELRGGLAEASAAGGLLGEGSARAGEGAELLAGGLDQAGAGGEQRQRRARAPRLGLRTARRGPARSPRRTAYNLSLGLGTLLPNLSAQGLGRARRLAARLRSAASSRSRRSPPPPTKPTSSPRVLAANREELARLRAQARTLNGGLGKLYSGGKRLQRRLGPPRRRSAAA